MKTVLHYCGAVLIALASFALACNGSSPSEETDTKREAHCLANPDSCVWTTEGTVKMYGFSTPVEGARGMELLNSTQENHAFQTDPSGNAGRYTWRRFTPNSTMRVTIEPGANTSVRWAKYDRNDIVPVCSADPIVKDGMLCRWIGELVSVGVGATEKGVGN